MNSLRRLALHSLTYENDIVIGDFNVKVYDTAISDFRNTVGLAGVIKEPKCYKNPEKPFCIDLIPTNMPHSFQTSCENETDLSDFHRMTLTATKMAFQKLRPCVINYT